MSDVTGLDQEKAKALVPDHQSWCQVVSHLHCCAEGPDDCDCGVTDARRGVAVALADQRTRARAPFLALAEAIRDGWHPSARHLETEIRRAAKDPT